LPWTTPEEVFEAWKKSSKGRPCDYSGMSYEKLTGGSGIQWPCNEDAPFGTERLFSDGKFFTDLEYCESFGHDLETGAYNSKEESVKLNPAGRAILKACHYIPSPEEPNDEYPLRLSTGRRALHFHTRTKTGRTPLQNACPAPEIEISKEDAEACGVQDGEEVLVESVRGRVQLPVRIGGTEKGQTFIPFHFGYFDSTDGKARAANELTTCTLDQQFLTIHVQS
jgi:ferredoxin-nitrate reductase